MIYVRCIYCLYNNVVKGIRRLDKKHFCLYMKNYMQVRAFERYIPLTITLDAFHSVCNGQDFECDKSFSLDFLEKK